MEDCLLLLLNLLKNNSSNQNFFKEGSFVQRLPPYFELQPADQSPQGGWSAQKVTNIHLMLQVRILDGALGSGEEIYQRRGHWWFSCSNSSVLAMELPVFCKDIDMIKHAMMLTIWNKQVLVYGFKIKNSTFKGLTKNLLWSELINWRQVMPYVLIDNGSGNGLLPDSTKPSPETMLAQNCWHPSLYTSTKNTLDNMVIKTSFPLLQVVRCLVTPNNALAAIAACQKVMNQCGEYRHLYWWLN